MNRRVLFIAVAACGVLTTAAILFVVLRSPEPGEAMMERPAAAPLPARPSTTVTPAPVEENTASTLDRTPAVEPAAEAPEVLPPAPAAAPPELGILRIEADVPGAQVFIDRRFVGPAPAMAKNITPGTHQLNVSAEGFESVAMPIEVTAGTRDIVVRLRQVRLDSAIDVIHRHRIGSCRGRLVATPQGMTYETSNRNDAFSAELLALETFEVDYLAKNLRVRLPQGRQFNFTDPEGNADRLFVFHRDVENARDRLRKGDTP